MASPLQQFEIKPLIPLEIAGVDLSFTNSSLWMMVAVLVAVATFHLATSRMQLVPSRLQAFGESVFGFINGMIRENLGQGGDVYRPLVMTIFLVVFLGNALGLVPGSFTFTSHLIVTGVLALLVFGIVVVIGFARHGTHFFSLFLPPGVPLWLAPLIVPIEIISFFVRPVTLSVRLFANMMAGHILLKVLAGFSVGMATMGLGGYMLGILPMAFNAILIAFEFLIAFLQAYVFAVLTCIYLKDTLELEH